MKAFMQLVDIGFGPCTDDQTLKPTIRVFTTHSIEAYKVDYIVVLVSGKK